jgi:hypothetical protein
MDTYLTSTRPLSKTYGAGVAGAADVVCVLFVGAEVTFLLDFECGDRAAVAGEEEKVCWEGRRLDRERRAQPDGRKGISLVAIMENSPLHREPTLCSGVERSIKQRNCTQ